MKMSHLYFDKYCTRTVQFENASGSFHFNGRPIPREKIKDRSTHKALAHTLSDSQSLLDSPSKILILPSQTQNSYDLTSGFPTTRAVSHNAVKAKTKTLHPDVEAELRAKQIETIKHIYHDNNFVRISQEEHRDAALASSRMWMPSVQKLKSTVALNTSVVVTPAPPNQSALGLTPLRMYGGGQDKPHHIPVSKSVVRLKVK